MSAQRNRWLAVLVVLIGLVVAQPAAAGECWLVSTRHLGCGCWVEPPLCVWRLGPDCCWVNATIEEFLATADPAVPITFFFHGNRNDVARSIEVGWQTYNALSCDAGDRPFRLVIWSWPSDRVPGPRRDALVKIFRSDCEAFFLATVLNRLRPDARVNLLGFSLGARIATGALELLAGGQVAGRMLAGRDTAPRVPMRAMLVASAEGADWLVPGRAHGQATSLLEQLFATRNGCDRVLRLYRRVDPCGADAMGYAGPYCSESQCVKFDVADVSCSVGREHKWENYFFSPEVRSRLAWYAFLATP